MICQRCGYCCIHYMVVIVDDPELGIKDDNMIVKSSGVRCKHLQGTVPGKMSCALHDKPWYKKTPCFSHGQIEENKDNPCRMGVFILSKKRTQKDLIEAYNPETLKVGKDE